MIESAIISIAKGAGIAIFSSWLTVIFSLKKFQEKKFWEYKLEAYTKIIESLHVLKQYMLTEQSLETGELYSISKEESRRLFDRYNIAQEAILKFKDIGSLVISKEALLLLNQYVVAFNKAQNINNRFDYTDVVYDAADKCLNSLIKIAKKDLKKGNYSYKDRFFLG